jgi:toxin secretion/phage lysis holin
VNGKVSSYIAGAIAVFGALVARIPLEIQVLLVLMVLDIVLGAIIAIRRRDVSSDEFGKGVAKKMGIIVLLTALRASEPVLQFDAMDYAAVFFVVYELISITENAARLGVPIPERVAHVLATMRGERDEQDRDEVQSNTQNQS